MSVPPLLPGPDPHLRGPSRAFPHGACDCHAHVFGPEAAFPYVANAAYRFPAVGLDDYKAMLAALGCTRGVLVQPSVYGTDNRFMVEVLRRAPTMLRGVAVVAPDVSDAEIEALHEAGVRGVRVNLASQTAGLTLDDAPRLAARIKGLGWHLQFFPNLAKMPDLAERLAALPVPCVIDHFGLAMAADGTQGSAFQSLLRLAALEHVWFKLVGPYRLSTRVPDFPDVAPLARRLIAAAPTRCVWATDWPHPNAVPMPNDGDLAEALFVWAPDEQVRTRILVENPARLYGFAE